MIRRWNGIVAAMTVAGEEWLIAHAPAGAERVEAGFRVEAGAATWGLADAAVAKGLVVRVLRP